MNKVKGRQQAPARNPKPPSQVKPPRSEECFKFYIALKHFPVNPEDSISIDCKTMGENDEDFEVHSCFIRGYWFYIAPDELGRGEKGRNHQTLRDCC